MPYIQMSLSYSSLLTIFPQVFAHLRSNIDVLSRYVTLFKIERYGGLFFARFPLVLLRKSGMHSHARLHIRLIRCASSKFRAGVGKQDSKRQK